MWKSLIRIGCRPLKSRRRNEMETFYYIVESIDGDYANLKRTDIATEDVKLVARALLPDGIDVGVQLKYEMFEYEVM